MEKSEVIVLGVLAFVGYAFYRYSNGQSVPLIGSMGSLNANVDSGGAPSINQQDMYGMQGMPAADYTSGPNFYVANQPWYGSSPMGGVMPMNSASSNVTGAPSMQATGCSNC